MYFAGNRTIWCNLPSHPSTHTTPLMQNSKSLSDRCLPTCIGAALDADREQRNACRLALLSRENALGLHLDRPGRQAVAARAHRAGQGRSRSAPSMAHGCSPCARRHLQSRSLRWSPGSGTRGTVPGGWKA